MKPSAFAYTKAKSVEDAIKLLDQADARLLAGGQSLMATLNMRLSSPRLLIDLNGIGGLSGVSVRNGQVEIGALTRHAEAERSADIARHAPLIALAMPHIGHAAIRNRGTVGGSIAFADPAAELPACLLALDGEVEIAATNGTRTVKANAFFNEYLDIERDKLDVRNKYVPRVRRVLSGQKAARFFQIENKLDALINLGIANEIPLIPVNK